MMAIEFKNGAVCSRFYSDGSGELLASFKYFSDAEAWAKEKVASDAHAKIETTVVATCLYSGASRMFYPPKAAS